MLAKMDKACSFSLPSPFASPPRSCGMQLFPPLPDTVSLIPGWAQREGRAAVSLANSRDTREI